MTKAEAIPGAFVVVTSTDRAQGVSPPDRRVWAAMVRHLLGRRGWVISRRRSAQPLGAAGAPTYMFAELALELEPGESRRRVVQVPLSGLELVRERRPVEIPLELESGGGLYVSNPARRPFDNDGGVSPRVEDGGVTVAARVASKVYVAPGYEVDAASSSVVRSALTPAWVWPAYGLGLLGVGLVVMRARARARRGSR
jgi:hypothetical protein